MEPWVVEVLRRGYCLPFSSTSSLSPVPIPLPINTPSSTKRIALRGEVVALLAKGAIEPAPPSPSFYSHLFVVWKTSGVVEAHDRLVSFERVCPSNSFQDGIQPVGPQFHSEGRLYRQKSPFQNGESWHL